MRSLNYQCSSSVSFSSGSTKWRCSILISCRGRTPVCRLRPCGIYKIHLHCHGVYWGRLHHKRHRCHNNTRGAASDCDSPNRHRFGSNVCDCCLDSSTNQQRRGDPLCPHHGWRRSVFRFGCDVYSHRLAPVLITRFHHHSVYKWWVYDFRGGNGKVGRCPTRRLVCSLASSHQCECD